MQHQLLDNNLIVNSNGFRFDKDSYIINRKISIRLIIEKDYVSIKFVSDFYCL